MSRHIALNIDQHNCAGDGQNAAFIGAICHVVQDCKGTGTNQVQSGWKSAVMFVERDLLCMLVS